MADPRAEIRHACSRCALSSASKFHKKARLHTPAHILNQNFSAVLSEITDKMLKVRKDRDLKVLP